YLARAADSPARVRVAVDIGKARGPDEADERIAIPAAAEFEALWALRAMVRERRVDAERLESLGLSPDLLRPLAWRLAACRYGVIFHDADPPPERRDPLRALALGALVGDANERARVRLIGIRMPGNPVGAEAVLTWQTGYPCAIHFGRGYPRYGPGEFTGAALLTQGGADAVLLVGVNPDRHLTPEERERLGEIPTIVIGPAARAEGARVAVVTAPPEETPGCVYRVDGVPLQRRGGAGHPPGAAARADRAPPRRGPPPGGDRAAPGCGGARWPRGGSPRARAGRCGVTGRLRTAGGRVHAPRNGVDGAVADVCIEDGRIVESLPDDAPVLDARGLIVMPGGVDIHCHIAGPKVNLARRLEPERHRADPAPRRGSGPDTGAERLRSGTGGLVPSTFSTGDRYAGLGYTAAFEAAVPMLGARQAHQELNDTPVIDKAFFLLLGNVDFLLRLLARREQ